MQTPIWRPHLDSIKKSQLSQFMHFVSQQTGLLIQFYPDLYLWSVQNPALFWEFIWTFFDVISRKKADITLQHADDMLKVQWFFGAELNYAENLLRHRSDHAAVIYCAESGKRTTLTYNELYLKTAQLSSAFKKFGIKKDDRIAAWLPNCPEAIIGFLATASIGAIWSSCSPDFGIHGVLDRFGQINPKILLTQQNYKYNGKTYDLSEKIKELKSQIPSLEKVILVDEKNIISNEYVLYQDFIDKNATEINFQALPFDHPLYILYSSGTTGVPKCIVHRAGGVLLQHLKELGLHTNLSSQDIFTYYTTCGWMMWNWMISGLALGATLVLYDGSPMYPQKTTLFDLIDQEKITVFGTSAKYLAAVEKNELKPIKTHSLVSLKTILSTGSPLVPEQFDFVYEKIKKDVCLSSISGGTDIVSCFALGNPNLPVYRGELQCRGLGMKVDIFNDQGVSVRQEKGELVCTAPFPSMPLYFWNDPNGEKYKQAYFSKFKNCWAHGDYAELTEHDGLIIFGRSDTVLNPGGVRIGTAEIYRQVEKINEVLESIAIGQNWENDVRIILFVKLRENITLDESLITRIKKIIREEASPHHVPALIVQVPDIPKTINGKLVELAVKNIVNGEPIKNKDVIANPECLAFFSLPLTIK